MSLLFHHGSCPSPKVHITTGALLSHLSVPQAPTKKFPWRAIRDIEFIQTVMIVLPDDLYQIIWHGVEDLVAKTKYAKVFMKVEELLSGSFFNDYVKKGNILMLSEGKRGIDNIFSLKDGTLRIESVKEDYERAGLQGVPVQSGGRKHVKSRYVIEIDLRRPSMLHGKKGFERLLWAAKNVFNQSLSWVFIDLNPTYADINTPVLHHHPITQTLAHSTSTLENVSIPAALTSRCGVSPLASEPHYSEETQESLHELLEYLDLVFLGSPRVQSTDGVDSLISRYMVPGVLENSDNQIQNVRVAKWSGLMPSKWILDLFNAIIAQSRTANLEALPKQSIWLALTVTAHKSVPVGQRDGYTILLQPRSNQSESTQEDQGFLCPFEAYGSTENTAIPEGELSDPTHVVQPLMQVPSQPSSGNNSTSKEAGFQHYLCAEYIDCMTGP